MNILADNNSVYNDNYYCMITDNVSNAQGVLHSTSGQLLAGLKEICYSLMNRNVRAHVDDICQSIKVTTTKVPIFKIMVATSAIAGIYYYREDVKYYVNTRILTPLETWTINTMSGPVMPDYRSFLRRQGALHDVTVHAPTNHSHATAAQLRAKATLLMDHFITCIGKTPYGLSMSTREQNRGSAGNRYYYTCKDLQMSPIYSPPTDNHVITMVDVDYYVDLRRELRGQAAILYTFVPNSPAGSTADGIYCTNIDNTIDMTINGGGRYRHPLWDFDTDHLVVDHAFYSVFYLVEQIRVSDDRRIVYLNPVRVVNGPFARLLPGKRLCRRQLSYPGVAFTRFTKTKDDTTICYYSISKYGEYQSCTITSSTFSTAFIRTVECKEPNLGQIERVFNHAKVDSPLECAALFFDAYRRCPAIFGERPPIITSCIDKHTYQAVGPLVTEDGKPSMRAVWPGYCDNTYSPAKSFNNDNACIAGRIIEPRNKHAPLPPMYFVYFREFVEHLVQPNSVGTLAPLSYDEMLTKFHRPTQRAQVEQVKTTMNMTNPRVRSFQKAEAYPKITHPRNISTLPIDHNFELGQFIYPFSQHILKKTDWYAFGKTPAEISDSLYAKAQGEEYATNTDADKLDGSVRREFRELLLVLLMRAFPASYHMIIRNRMEKEMDIKASTAFGVRYDTGATNVSGSSDTAVLNSVINAYINYCAYRHHYESNVAYRKLGIYGGDDGSSFGLPMNTLVRTAAKFGISFRGEEIRPGSPMPFLGRVYLDPWTTNESMCDVLRQFRKLHLTASPKTTPDILALLRKASGLIQTDPKTPLISNWALAVIRISTKHFTNPYIHKLYHTTMSDNIYWSKFDTSVQFYPIKSKDDAMNLVTTNLNATTPEVEEVMDKFDKADKLEDLYLTGLFPTKLVVHVKAITNGEVMQPASRETIPQMVARKAQLKLKLCRFVEKGQDCKFGDKCTFSHQKAPKLPQQKQTAPPKKTVRPLIAPALKSPVKNKAKYLPPVTLAEAQAPATFNTAPAKPKMAIPKPKTVKTANAPKLPPPPALAAVAPTAAAPAAVALAAAAIAPATIVAPAIAATV